MARAGPRKVARYSEQFKATAVKLSSLSGVLIQEVAHALDIHPFMLSLWRKQVREGVIVAKSATLDVQTKAELKQKKGVRSCNIAFLIGASVKSIATILVLLLATTTLFAQSKDPEPNRSVRLEGQAWHVVLITQYPKPDPRLFTALLHLFGGVPSRLARCLVSNMPSLTHYPKGKWKMLRANRHFLLRRA